MIDRQGRVASRFFEDYYWERNTVSNIMLRAGTAATPVKAMRASTEHLDVTAYPSDANVARNHPTALRRFLEEAFGREAGWAIRGVAIRNLIPMVAAGDVDWVLDLYFKRPNALEKHELLHLVVALPAETARPRLVAELASPGPTNRQATVRAIGNMPYLDRRRLIQPLRDDPDPRGRSSAKSLSQDRTEV